MDAPEESQPTQMPSLLTKEDISQRVEKMRAAGELPPIVDPAPEIPAVKPKKRKASKKIGDEAEKMAVAVLEAQGYKCMRAWPRRIPINGGKVWIAMPQDFFGCWDIIAMRANTKPKYIQVTAKDGVWQEKLRDILACEPNGGWPTDFADFEVWGSKKRAMEKGMTRAEFLSWKHFDIKSLLPNGTLSETTKVPFV